jgi:hypothetical protein
MRVATAIEAPELWDGQGLGAHDRIYTIDFSTSKEREALPQSARRK